MALKITAVRKRKCISQKEKDKDKDKDKDKEREKNEGEEKVWSWKMQISTYLGFGSARVNFPILGNTQEPVGHCCLLDSI